MSIEKLIEEMREEAARESFPLDEEVYRNAGRDPLTPILSAGDLGSRLCFFARDLGRDEVHAGQPLYGAAGRLVRGGMHQAFFGKPATSSEDLQKAADKVLLCNTVPYKPPGNKAYLQKVKKRFRPFVERLLLDHWQGTWIITLGNEALQWFASYDVRAKELCGDPDKFTKSVEIKIANDTSSRQVILAPLPHPSPLNQKYYKLFPSMLQDRLKQYLAATSGA